MKNLIAEMARYGIKCKDIQRILKCSEKTARNKIKGITDFTYPEAENIRNEFFPTLPLEYLFSNETNQKLA